MLGAGNNIVLYVFPNVREVSTITGHAYHQRGVILGVFLGIDQDGFVDAVELNVGDAQIIQGCADQGGELFSPALLKCKSLNLSYKRSLSSVAGLNFPLASMISPPLVFPEGKFMVHEIHPS